MCQVMRHCERIQHIYASADPPADRHFAHAEKRGAFGKVNGVFFEGHTMPIVSTCRHFVGGHYFAFTISPSLVICYAYE